MGFLSSNVERAVNCTRGLGVLSLVLGVVVIICSIIFFPWVEPDRSHADYTYISAAPVEPQPTDLAQYKYPELANPPVSHSDPTVEFIDTHEYRSGQGETVGSIIACIIPGLLLLWLPRYMERLNLWAYLAAMAISLGFVAVYLLELMALLGLDCPIHREPIVTETMLRPVGIFLFALCLNALPDARDKYIKDRRQKR